MISLCRRKLGLYLCWKHGLRNPSRNLCRSGDIIVLSRTKREHKFANFYFTTDKQPESYTFSSAVELTTIVYPQDPLEVITTRKWMDAIPTRYFSPVPREDFSPGIVIVWSVESRFNSGAFACLFYPYTDLDLLSVYNIAIQNAVSWMHKI